MRAAHLPIRDRCAEGESQRKLARFHHKDGRTLGVELITDPAEVLKACQVRDRAWHFAAPYEEFTTRVPSAV
ncbi:DUF6879 family protein [Streptomyces sp. NBC_01511]|uniref:DUF6879 family protein n=1 Tax=Streptomyces sp. NBC_01511 TaxID=2903889 RepID=UPI00386F4F0D